MLQLANPVQPATPRFAFNRAVHPGLLQAINPYDNALVGVEGSPPARQPGKSAKTWWESKARWTSSFPRYHNGVAVCDTSGTQFWIDHIMRHALTTRRRHLHSWFPKTVPLRRGFALGANAKRDQQNLAIAKARYELRAGEFNCPLWSGGCVGGAVSNPRVSHRRPWLEELWLFPVGLWKLYGFELKQAGQSGGSRSTAG